MRRTVRALSVAALASFVLGFVGSAAFADPAAEVSPATVSPGGTVTISVSCAATDGTAPAAIDATSRAFAERTVQLQRVQGNDDQQSQTAYRGTARMAAAASLDAAPAAVGDDSAWTVDGNCPAESGGQGQSWSAPLDVPSALSSPCDESLGGSCAGGEACTGTDGSSCEGDDACDESQGSSCAGGEACTGTDGSSCAGGEACAETDGSSCAGGEACTGTNGGSYGSSSYGSSCGGDDPCTETHSDSCSTGPTCTGHSGSCASAKPCTESWGASCGGAAIQHGVQAGEGGSVTGSVPALVAGGVLIAGACGGAVYRVRRRRPAAHD